MRIRLELVLLAWLAGCAGSNYSGVASRPAAPPQADLPVVAADSTLFAMSKAVNGLAARVENGQDENEIFLRLENQGNASLRIPVELLSGTPSPFALQARVKGAWTDVPWRTVAGEASADLTAKMGYSAPTLQLLPGQSALLEIEVGIADIWESADLERVEVHVADDSALWQGDLRTPERAIHVSEAQRKAQAGRLEFPTYFPAFGRVGGFNNGSGDESMYFRLIGGNQPLLAQLTLYKPEEVRAEMEKRMADAPDVHHKLLLATQAALRGSKPAQDFIQQCRLTTDYDTLNSSFDALENAALDDTRPQWAMQAMAEEILNPRTIVDSQWHQTTTISRMVDQRQSFSLRLGQLKYKDAVPSLITKAQSAHDSDGAIWALGEMGDPRAIPVLMKLLQTSTDNESLFTTRAEALAKLHATDAVPLMLPNAQALVEPLENMGDTRAISAVEKLPPSMKTQLALITLRDPDPTTAYIRLMEDRTYGEFDRRERSLGSVITRTLADPALIRAIKTDPSGAVANNAVSIIGDRYRYPDAVTGLIECLDANFDRSADPKRAYAPEMFRNHIAEVLRDITGQSIGTDKAQWDTWWRTAGKHL